MIEPLVQDYFIDTYESDSTEGIITTSDEHEDCLQVFSLFDKQVLTSEDKEENTSTSTKKRKN